MTRARLLLTRSALTLALTAMTTPALAAETPEDVAGRLAAEGIERFDAKDFAGALERFQEAWSIYSGDPVLLSFMGQATEELGRTNSALRYYEQYLATGPEPEDAVATRAAIERVRAAPPRPTTPAPSGAATQAPAPPPSATEGEAGRGALTTRAAVVTAVALAALGGALYFRGDFLQAADDANAAKTRDDRAAYEDAQDRGQGAATAFYVSAAAAALAAGWAGHLWLTLPPPAPSQARPTPGLAIGWAAPWSL